MYALALTAELTGVTDLRPLDTPETPFYYMFKVSCTSCREVHPNRIGINRFESNEISGSKGEANFVWKCKNCRRESSATIKSGPTPVVATDPPKAQNIITFELRGCELQDFKSEGEWLATGTESGSKFTEIEIGEDGEWFGYDEKTREEVSVKEVKWEVRRA
ncbi:DUF866 domain protein [Peziza echinospora]|nr:DUF866 domain protein [Peziza echinospora]